MPDTENTPIEHYKWDFFIGRSTVDGTKSLTFKGRAPFMDKLFENLQQHHNTLVTI
jgi:hypothetical protein